MRVNIVYHYRFPHAPLVAAENGSLYFTDGSVLSLLEIGN